MRSYRMYGLGNAEAAADPATAAGQIAADATAAAVTAAVGADVVALQKELEALKKENAELKSAMGKFWMGAAVGAAGGYFWGRRRSF